MSAVTVPLLAGTLGLLVEDEGEGPPVLLLHGGAGPATMRGLAAALAGHRSGRRAVMPVIPGFDGTDRPGWLGSVPDLATAYLALLDALGLDGVVAVGNSVGGWIAAEMAARRPARLAGLLLLDAVGIAPTAETGAIANPFLVPPAERAGLSFHDPARFAPPPSPEAAARMAANGVALGAYAGEPFMHDPGLAERLGAIAVPTVVAWGMSDRIVGPAYGRRLAALIPGARFEGIEEAGHLPQVERPDRVAALVAALG